VLGEGKLALGYGLEQRRLAAAVLAQEAVAAGVVDLERRVGEEDLAVEHQRRRCDLDVAGGFERGEHARGDAVRQAVLVLLHGELLDLLVHFEVLVEPVIVGLIAVDRRGAGGVL
jgi:hypothetical protein